MATATMELIEVHFDRVRAHTDPEINRKIDETTVNNIRRFANASPETITLRLAELDKEWDMERLLETNASALALTGTVFGILVSKAWLAIPIVVTAFLLNHAVRGWCPPVPLLRRAGVRTRREIERERFALKLLRGDFEGLSASAPEVEEIVQLVEA